MFSLKMIRSKCKNSSESSDVNHLLRKETFLINKQIHLGLWLITDLSSLCLEILILSRSSIVLTLRGSSSACLKHNKNNQSRGQKQGYFTWIHVLMVFWVWQLKGITCRCTFPFNLKKKKMKATASLLFSVSQNLTPL